MNNIPLPPKINQNDLYYFTHIPPLRALEPNQPIRDIPLKDIPRSAQLREQEHRSHYRNQKPKQCYIKILHYIFDPQKNTYDSKSIGTMQWRKKARQIQPYIQWSNTENRGHPVTFLDQNMTLGECHDMMRHLFPVIVPDVPTPFGTQQIYMPMLSGHRDTALYIPLPGYDTIDTITQSPAQLRMDGEDKFQCTFNADHPLLLRSKIKPGPASNTPDLQVLIDWIQQIPSFSQHQRIEWLRYCTNPAAIQQLSNALLHIHQQKFPHRAHILCHHAADHPLGIHSIPPK